MSIARLLAPLAFATFGTATMAQSDTLAAGPVANDYALVNVGSDTTVTPDWGTMAPSEMRPHRKGKDPDWLVLYFNEDSTFMAIRCMNDTVPADKSGEHVDWDKTEEMMRTIIEKQNKRKPRRRSNYEHACKAITDAQKLRGQMNRDVFRSFGHRPMVNKARAVF